MTSQAPALDEAARTVLRLLAMKLDDRADLMARVGSRDAEALNAIAALDDGLDVLTHLGLARVVHRMPTRGDVCRAPAGEYPAAPPGAVRLDRMPRTVFAVVELTDAGRALALSLHC